MRDGSHLKKQAASCTDCIDPSHLVLMEELKAILCDYHVKFKELVCDEVGGTMSWASLSLYDIHSTLAFTLKDRKPVGGL